MSDLAADGKNNPFPGLRPFGEDEEDRFFGRESQVDAMVDRLEATHFLAVVGTSGSGKSSLVNCGLRPALSRGLMTQAGSSWRMAQFRPGTDPIGAMAQALAEQGGLFRDHAAEGLTLTQLIEVNLRMSKCGLVDIFEQAALGEGVNLLVVVDQFEELFRYRQLATAGSDSSQRNESAAFVNLLLEISERAPEHIFIVLTMRSDFLGDCTKFPGLAEAINGGQYLVPRLTRDERRAAIEGPIHVAGAEISPVLLTQLVNDVGDDPDQLSILQHALNRTWADWRKQGGHGPLEFAHYKAIGTMTDALNQHANEAFDELNERQQHICAKMFKALTDKATDPRGVRRPTRLSTLCVLTEATAAELVGVIDVFRMRSRSFLMPPISETLQPERVIDISHESLMRVWKLLEHWANEEAESERVYHRLAETAADEAVNKASFYRGPELQVALAWRERDKPSETWAARYHPGFAQAMAFLDKSHAELEKEKRRSARELHAFRVAAIVMGSLFFVAAGLGILAYWSYIDAQDSRINMQRAKARLFAEAADLEPMDKARTISLALESLPDPTSPDPRVSGRPLVFEMQQLLLDAVRDLHEFSIFTGHTRAVNALVVTPDGQRIVSGSDDATARVWDARTGKEVLAPLNHAGPVLSVAITPDGQRIVTGSTDHMARVWSATSGEKQLELPAGHEGRVLAVAVSPDGSRIITGSDRGVAQVWDINSGELLLELKGHGRAIFGVTVTPDGENIITASGDQTARIWDAKTGEELRQLTGHKQPVLGVAVSPDGWLIVTRSADHTVRTWDAKTGQELFQLRNSNHINSTPLSIAVIPDGKHIVVGWEDTTVRVWEARNDVEIAAMRLKGHQSGVRALAVTPDSTRIITGGGDNRAVNDSGDNTVRVWGFTNSNKPPRELNSARTRRELVDLGKKVVPSCLTIKQRKDLALGPRPPDWCIDLEKYPYSTTLWKDWKAGKPVHDSGIAGQFADLADNALIGVGDIEIALDAAKISVEFDKSLVWTRVNLAHAEMFSHDTRLARKEYLSHCGTPLEIRGGILWEEAVLKDFRSLRSRDRFDPLMDEVEKRFGEHDCLPNIDKR